MKAADLRPDTSYVFRRAPGRSGTPIERVTVIDAVVTNGRVRVRTDIGEERTATLGQLIAPWSDVAALRAEEAAWQRMPDPEDEGHEVQLEPLR